MEQGTSVVAIINEKGGVGKTTTAVHLAAATAECAIPTLLVDLDPQQNASFWCGISPEAEGRATAAELLDPNDSTLVLPSTCPWSEHLVVVPSSRRLAGAAIRAPSLGDGWERLLKDRLRVIGEGRRLIILDCPPTLGPLSVLALSASTHMLIPVESDVMALSGIAHVLETAKIIKERVNPILALMGFVVTRHDGRTLLAGSCLGRMREKFPQGVFNTVIGTNVRIRESWSHQLPVFKYAPDSKGAEQYRSLAAEVLSRLSLSAQEVPREQVA